MESAVMLTQDHEEIPMERVKCVVSLFSLMSFIVGLLTVLIIQELDQSITNWLAYSTFENNTKIEELAPSIKNTPAEEQHGSTVGCEPTNVLFLAREYIESEIQLAELTSGR